MTGRALGLPMNGAIAAAAVPTPPPAGDPVDPDVAPGAAGPEETDDAGDDDEPLAEEAVAAAELAHPDTMDTASSAATAEGMCRRRMRGRPWSVTGSRPAGAFLDVALGVARFMDLLRVAVAAPDIRSRWSRCCQVRRIGPECCAARVIAARL